MSAQLFVVYFLINIPTTRATFFALMVMEFQFVCKFLPQVLKEERNCRVTPEKGGEDFLQAPKKVILMMVF